MRLVRIKDKIVDIDRIVLIHPDTFNGSESYIFFVGDITPEQVKLTVDEIEKILRDPDVILRDSNIQKEIDAAYSRGMSERVNSWRRPAVDRSFEVDDE